MADKYQWATPHNWLEDHVSDILIRKGVQGANTQYKRIIRDLTYYLDADQIQEVFESEMDEDGYFDTFMDTPCGETILECDWLEHLEICPDCQQAKREDDQHAYFDRREGED